LEGKIMKKMLASVAVSAMAITGSALAVGDHVHVVDLTGLEHFNNVGTPGNIMLNLDLAALAGSASGSKVIITGIAWDGTMTATSPSWISDARFAFLDSNLDAAGLFVTPGAGINSAGVDVPLSSQGMIKLDDVGLDDLQMADGILNVELYDAFSEPTHNIWGQGSTLSIQYNVIPAPAALALLGLAGLAGARRRRG